jgi:hypothetical protein
MTAAMPAIHAGLCARSHNIASPVRSSGSSRSALRCNTDAAALAHAASTARLTLSTMATGRSWSGPPFRCRLR